MQCRYYQGIYIALGLGVGDGWEKRKEGGCCKRHGGGWNSDGIVDAVLQRKDFRSLTKSTVAQVSELYGIINRQMTKSAHQYVKITESAHISYLITGSAFRDFKIVITQPFLNIFK
jgi:hypothetical protein